MGDKGVTSFTKNGLSPMGGKPLPCYVLFITSDDCFPFGNYFSAYLCIKDLWLISQERLAKALMHRTHTLLNYSNRIQTAGSVEPESAWSEIISDSSLAEFDCMQLSMWEPGICLVSLCFTFLIKSDDWYAWCDLFFLNWA